MQSEAVSVLSGIGVAQRRVTEYFRWTAGRWYLEVSVDANGGMSYSTNMPQSMVGKGLSWHAFDDRYLSDLKQTLSNLNGMANYDQQVAREQEEAMLAESGEQG